MGRNFENITITVKDILQSYSFPNVIPHQNPWESMTADQIITAGKDHFFDFTFPWYSEDNVGLDEFKELFLHKYYLRQIGQETTGQFKLFLKSRLLEKMPYYKELYKTTIIEYDPLVNKNLIKEILSDVSENEEMSSNKTESYDSTLEQSASGNSKLSSTINTETNNQSVHSENPEITVSNNDYASSMDREKRKTDEEGVSDSNSSAKSSESKKELSTNVAKNSIEKTKNNKGKEILKGFDGDYQSEAILKFRQTITNINEMICDDMKDLFLGYYGGVYYGINW